MLPAMQLNTMETAIHACEPQDPLITDRDAHDDHNLLFCHETNAAQRFHQNSIDLDVTTDVLDFSLKQCIMLEDVPNRSRTRSKVWKYFKRATLQPLFESYVAERDSDTYSKLLDKNSFVCLLCFNDKTKELRNCIQKFKHGASTNGLKHLKKQHTAEFHDQLPLSLQTVINEQLYPSQQKLATAGLKKILTRLADAVQFTNKTMSFDDFMFLLHYIDSALESDATKK